MDVQSLKLQPRAVIGKKVKALRRQGIVPVHMYGKGTEPLALQVENQVLQRVLTIAGTNIPLSVEVDGEEGDSLCFVREVQRHPVTEGLLHVDFMSVDVTETVQAEVPIVISGNAPAVLEMGGTLLQPLQSLLVESLPMNIPPSFELDVSQLDDFEKGIFVRDVAAAADVTMVTDPDELIARVSAPRIDVEDVAAEAEEGVEEGDEEGEGEEDAAGEGASAEASER
jgi:large subunit ribosomal protein L25